MQTFDREDVCKEPVEYAAQVISSIQNSLFDGPVTFGYNEAPVRIMSIL